MENTIRVIITGSTGMVGKGALYDCLDNSKVTEILVVNREPVGLEHPKLKEIIHKDFFDLSPIKEELKDYDACFFCLGTSAFRMSEETYTKITYELTMNVAKTLLALNPSMTFCYVSGAGTDETESKSMWARVKGRTENDLLKTGFKDAYMLRPGYIHPMRGIKSKTPLYNALIPIFKPFYPLMKNFFPNSVTDNLRLGRAMTNVVLRGYDKKRLEVADINALAALG